MNGNLVKWHTYLASLFLVVIIFTVSYTYRPTNETVYGTRYANNLTSPSYSTAGCPLALVNVSKSQLLLLINETKVETIAGACALSALASYNSSGVLVHFDVSINLTKLNTAFLAGHPNITPINSSSIKNVFIQNPDLHCEVSPSFNSIANKTRVLRCILKGQVINKNNYVEHVNYTIPKKVPMKNIPHTTPHM